MKVTMIMVPMMDHDPQSGLVPGGMDALRACPNYGAYLLCGVLLADDHSVVVADLVARSSLDLTPYLADIQDSDLIGIGGTSFVWPTILQLVQAIRGLRRDVPIVVGGVHATLFDRYVLETCPVQYVVRGDGERAFPALCRCLEGKGDLADVPNLSWIDGKGQVVRNPVLAMATGDELGRFPLPHYEALPFRAYHYLPFESSRGCAHNCSFCSTPYRCSWRPMPPERVVQRLERSLVYLDRVRSGQVQLVDDEFSIDPHRAMEIARIIQERGLQPRLRYCSRVRDILVDGFIETVSGVTANLFVGAECGYDEGLTEARKGMTCGQIELAAERLCRQDMGGNATFSFMVGLPWETKAEVEKTVRFAMRLADRYSVHVTINWYMQVPGSSLWNDARRRQVLNESMYDRLDATNGPYLFRANLQLDPQQAWEIDDLIGQYAVTMRGRSPDDGLVTYNTPTALSRYFPRGVICRESGVLENLRELTRSVARRR